MIKISIILTVLIFSLLIIVHELGHFATAKWSGVTVNEFWLGMGPTIFKKHYKGTDYCLKALPFGGAVVMEGEDSESDKDGSIANAPKYKKAIIMAAGSFMNFVLGFVIIFILFVPVTQYVAPVFESFEDGFKYESQDGFMVGDEILSIDGYSILLPQQDILEALAKNKTGVYDIKIKRDGEKIMLNDFKFEKDTFIVDDKEVKLYGFTLDVIEPDLLEKLEITLKTGASYARIVWFGLGDLFSGNVAVEDMSGPVGITVMIGEAAAVSYSTMWNFVAFISINLGIMNLLPFPALDGGRLLILAVEAISRKKISPQIEGIIHGAGLIILLGFMVYVTFNDIFVKILG